LQGWGRGILCYEYGRCRRQCVNGFRAVILILVDRRFWWWSSLAETEGDDYSTISFKQEVPTWPMCHKGIFLHEEGLSVRIWWGFYMTANILWSHYYGKVYPSVDKMVLCAITSVLADRSCWICIAKILNIKLRLVLIWDIIALSVAKQEVPLYKIGAFGFF